jgi:hypothetical protein
MEWMEIGFQGKTFKIPKEYNHQLVEEAKILMKEAKEKGRQGIIEELIGKAVWIEGVNKKWNDEFIDFIDIRIRKTDWEELKEENKSSLLSQSLKNIWDNKEDDIWTNY